VLKAHPYKEGKMNRPLYKQAGNSIAVPIFESLFVQIFKELDANKKYMH